MSGVIVEIRAGEGGDDAKLLVVEQYKVYERAAVRHGVTLTPLDVRDGFVMLRAEGKESRRLFAYEAGGHRWQRVPPTERHGRVHTSTVTVAVLEAIDDADLKLDERDLEWSTCRGSGAGGQHRNVTDSAVILVHKPSGLRVRSESERSQFANKRTARQILAARLAAQQQADAHGAHNDRRRRQVGSGMRGDKCRTIALQRDNVSDHETGKSMSAKRYVRGEIDALWP